MTVKEFLDITKHGTKIMICNYDDERDFIMTIVSSINDVGRFENWKLVSLSCELDSIIIGCEEE